MYQSPPGAPLPGGLFSLHRDCFRRMKAKAKRKRVRRRRSRESSPVTMLESELRALHRDLRMIAKAYITRLENDLLVCLAALTSYGPIGTGASGNAAPDPRSDDCCAQSQIETRKRPSQRFAQNRFAHRRLGLDDRTQKLNATLATTLPV